MPFVSWLALLGTGLAYMVPQTMEPDEANRFFTKELATYGPKLQLAFYKQRGNGLKANVEIKEGETVLELPWENVISGEERYYFSGYMEQGDLQIFLHGRLLFEKFMQDNSTSFLNNYVHSLPIFLKNYPSWTPDQRSLLTDNLFSHEYQDPELIRLGRLYEEFKRQISGLPKMNHALIRQEAWDWAVSIVRSRAYRSTQAEFHSAKGLPFDEADGDKKVYLLVPLYDLINHDAKGQGSVEVELTKKSFKVKAKRSIAAGEEILINYGVSHNIELLKDYGFFIKNNPGNILSITAFNTTDCFETKVNDLCIYTLKSTEFSEPLLRHFRKGSVGMDVLPFEANWYSNYYSLSHYGNTESRSTIARAVKSYRSMLEIKHNERPDMRTLRGLLDQYSSSQPVERMILEFLLDEHKDFYKHLDHIDHVMFRITLTEAWLYTEDELREMLGQPKPKDEL